MPTTRRPALTLAEAATDAGELADVVANSTIRLINQYAGQWQLAEDGKALIVEALRALSVSKTGKPRDIASVAAVFRDAFVEDPGHSDLDDAQPITIRVTLGAWRRLDLALWALADLVERSKK